MLDLFLGRVKEDREDAVSSAPTMVLCAEGLLGLGRGPGSLVARWCSGLARVEKNDPANDGLWTPNPGRNPSTGVRISPGLPFSRSNMHTSSGPSIWVRAMGFEFRLRRDPGR